MKQIKKCYETCPGKDEDCSLYKSYKDFLKEDEPCTVYQTLGNDIEKLHEGKPNITYGDIVDSLDNTLDDIQFHIDKQGMKCNVELMGRAFKQQYKNRLKDNIILKDEQNYIINNVWDCIDAKTKVMSVYKMLHRGKW